MGHRLEEAEWEKAENFFNKNMRTFFHLFMPAVIAGILVYRIFRNLNSQPPEPILVQSLLLLAALGFLLFRIRNLIKSRPRRS